MGGASPSSSTTGALAHTDFRAFLQALLRRRGCTRRSLARHLGKSEAWMSRMMNGSIRLSPGFVPPMARFFELESSVASYMRALVDLESDSERIRRQGWARVLQVRARMGLVPDGPARFLAEQPWSVRVVYELLASGMRGERRIARIIEPQRTKEHVAKAVALLRTVGLDKPQRGTSSNLLELAPWLVPPKHHRQALLLAAGALKREPHSGTSRHFGAFTMALCQSAYERLMDRIRILELEIAQIVLEDPGPRGRVYAVGVQFFPVSAVLSGASTPGESEPEPSMLGSDADPPQFGAFIKERLHARGLTQQMLATRMGKSPAWVSRMVRGMLEMKRDLLPPLGRILELSGEEVAYAESLLEMDAASETMRDDAINMVEGREILECADRTWGRTHGRVGWAAMAIHELSQCVGFRDDPAWIGETLRPKVTEDQVELALERLVQMKLRSPAGDVTTPVVAEREPDSRSAFDHHLDHLELTHRAMYRHSSRGHAQLSVVSLSRQGFEEIRSHWMAIEAEAASIAVSSTEPPDRVYCLGFQLYPVSRVFAREW